jgi:hypothetical protein
MTCSQALFREDCRPAIVGRGCIPRRRPWRVLRERLPILKHISCSVFIEMQRIPRTVKQRQHVRGALDTGSDFHELSKSV